MTEPSDAELVDRVRRGAQEAFGELVRRHERGAVALAHSLLEDRAEAEDMAQEAFIRALRNLDLLADPAKFGPWLRRIVFGTCVDWLRRFRPELYRSRTPGTEEEARRVRSRAPSPLERVEQRELSERVLAAVERLPPRYRVPLTLYHLDGLSHAKVAGTLGVPVGTVRSLVTRARRKLAPAIEEFAEEAREMQPPIDEVFEEQRPGTPRLLHVLNGDATAYKLRRSGVPGTLAVWADVLHEGPVPPDDSMEEWLRTRARFIAGCGWATFEEALAKHREWQDAMEAFREYDEVVLWFEHDLFDQLLLVRHLDWFARQEMGSTRLSLICIGSYPGVENFVGLGQLAPDQLASLLDTRQPVTSLQTRLAREAWRAFTSPDPLRLERLVRGDTSALPFLEGALWRFLQEYPSARDGLPRTERQLLEALAGGPLTPVELYHASQRREERVFMGDSTVWLRVRGLAAGPAPLVETEVGEARMQLPEGTVRITRAGREVLEGREDWVRLGGVERWLGGVHLQGGEARWRWDDARGGLVAADGATA